MTIVASGPASIQEQTPVAAPSAPPRLTSLDAYRGFVMLLMASEGLRIKQVARTLRTSPTWNFLAHQVDHSAWVGCTLWDLIQPSFMFMVGVAMPFSLASRRAKGQRFAGLLVHALWRSLVLILLGIFLRSVNHSQTYFTFEDVLTQIGLGYPFLFLLAWCKPRTQFLAALLLLIGTWIAFVAYPLPPPDFNYRQVGVPKEWPHLTGRFSAHFDKNTNIAARADQWFLNLFPREKNKPFVYNGGGYETLNFVPSLATMIFGLLAGRLMRSPGPPLRKYCVLFVAGVSGISLGYLLDEMGLCPLVKPIWTPGWAIFSTGWTCLLLATFYGFIDIRGWRKWAFPLVVVGMNSIAMYVMSHLFAGFIIDATKIHLGSSLFSILGRAYTPMLEMSATLLILWLICLWMYHRRIFLRI